MAAAAATTLLMVKVPSSCFAGNLLLGDGIVRRRNCDLGGARGYCN